MPSRRTITRPTRWSASSRAGALSYGMGDKLDRGNVGSLTKGYHVTMGAGMNHYVFTSDPVEVQVNGMGPFQITYVEPGRRPADEVAPVREAQPMRRPSAGEGRGVCRLCLLRIDWLQANVRDARSEQDASPAKGDGREELKGGGLARLVASGESMAQQAGCRTGEFLILRLRPIVQARHRSERTRPPHPVASASA